MKIGTNTLLVIGGVAVAGYLYMQNKKKKQGQASSGSSQQKGGGFGGGGGSISPIVPAVVIAQPSIPTTPKEEAKPTPQQQVAQNVTQQAPSSQVVPTTLPPKNFVDVETEDMTMSYLDFDGMDY
tara:strand:+ start:100 stop:474 length:375 start_codon:yes stop_codon:yes gene_type:complete